MGLLGAAILCIVALGMAFRRKTLPWIGGAGVAAIFFVFVWMIFTRGLWDQSARAHREVAASNSHPNFVPSPSVSSTPAPVPLLAEQVQKAVVQIIDVSKSGQPIGSGTGFFISATGHLVTCWHVVALGNVDHIRVMRSDGSQCEVEGVLGFSAINDVVLLKAAVSGADFLPLRPAAADKPPVGTRVLLFGNPGQLRGVWSEGAVSGFIFKGKDVPRDSLRFDAPVAPGSSGSPVVDTHKGDVIGVASAAGWLAGNFGVPYYYVTELVNLASAAKPVPLAEFKANLEKEKPGLKERVYVKERADDFPEAGRLCVEYSARYPGDVWGTWEHAQMSFALDDYNAGNFYADWLVPAKDPGDDLLCAIKFECVDALFQLPAQRETLKSVAELLRKNYSVQVCAVQMAPGTALNARGKPEAKSDILYEFDSGEHVFAKEDRVRNSAGKEAVTWRKVLLLPTRDRIHGSEGWVNERYIAPLNLP